MTSFRKWTISLTGLVVLFTLFPLSILAHPEHDYVQRSYLTLTANELLLDVDLTPGATIGIDILMDIDTDGDYTISESEIQQYAGQVQSALSVEVANQALELTLLSVEYPTPALIASGGYPIRLHFQATLPDNTAGEHQIIYENAFAPELYENTYLVNAFVDTDVQDNIDITEQERDWYQQTMTLSYTLSAPDTGQAQAVSETKTLLDYFPFFAN